MSSFDFCGFCRRNKEKESIYRSHRLKDQHGKVVCPQLFKYRCELCGATGSEAHTRSYCPIASRLRNQFQQQEQQRQQQQQHQQQIHNSAGRPVASACSSGWYQLQRSASNSISSDSTTSSSRDQPWRPQQQEEQQQPPKKLIQLSNDRMFRNMARVNNTRYNSAGKLRRPPISQQF